MNLQEKYLKTMDQIIIAVGEFSGLGERIIRRFMRGEEVKMSLNYSIKAVQRRRREMQWQAKGKILGEWLCHLQPLAWIFFGIIIGIIIKAR